MSVFSLYSDPAPLISAPFGGEIHTVVVKPAKGDWMNLLERAAPQTDLKNPIRAVGNKLLHPHPPPYQGRLRVHFVWFGMHVSIDTKTAIRRMGMTSQSLVVASPYYLWWSLAQVPHLARTLLAVCQQYHGGVGIVATEELDEQVGCVWCCGAKRERRAHLYPASTPWQDRTVFAFVERRP